MFSRSRPIASLLICLCLQVAVYGQGASIVHKKERLARIRNATVRILINGLPKGTGFVISKDGLIATAFHVVFHEYLSDDTQTISSSIEVEFNDGLKLPATVHKSCLLKDTTDKGTDDAFFGDYCILQVASTKLLDFLPLGTFADAYEGADIYISGYPLPTNKAIVNFGVLSTKSTISFTAIGNKMIPKIDGTKTEIAWLDITMNQGNSGGPVVLVGKEPKDDRVVGIISFKPNPSSQELQDLIDAFNRQQTGPSFSSLGGLPNFDSLINPVGSKRMSDEDLRKFANPVTSSLQTSSLGIGACVSVDYLKSRLPRQ